jgi:hypothetical protein
LRIASEVADAVEDSEIAAAFFDAVVQALREPRVVWTGDASSGWVLLRKLKVDCGRNRAALTVAMSKFSGMSALEQRFASAALFYWLSVATCRSEYGSIDIVKMTASDGAASAWLAASRILLAPESPASSDVSAIGAVERREDLWPNSEDDLRLVFRLVRSLAPAKWEEMSSAILRTGLECAVHSVAYTIEPDDFYDEMERLLREAAKRIGGRKAGRIRASISELEHFKQAR